MVAAVLLLLGLSLGDVQGVVRSHPSGEPVPHAVVRIAALGRAAMADERGHFVIAGVPAGTYAVSGSAMGHDSASARITVGEGAAPWLELRLPQRVVVLQAVEVEADALAAAPVAGPGAVRMDPGSLKGAPSLAEPDVLRSVQSLPSVAAASDFSTALYVRGGSPDQTLVRVDGAPLFNPFHLGGLFSAVDPDAVASVEVHAGTLPASAGDRLSGVVDIWTRDGGRDRVRTTGAVSMISTRAAVDGPLPGGRGSALVSIRRTYVDAVAAAARGLGILDRRFPYSFSDAHLKLTHDVGRTGRLSAAAYVNDEGFRMPAEWGIGKADWGWGSRAASVNWRQALSGTVIVSAAGAVSRFDGRLATEDGAAGGSRPVARSGMRSLTASAQVARFGPAWRATAGVALEALALQHRVEDVGPGGVGAYLPPLHRSERPRTVAGFVEGEWLPSDRLSGRLGVRVLHVDGGATVFLPRAGIRGRLTDHWSITAAGGSYAQAVTTLRDEESVVSGVFAYDLLAAAPSDRPARARDVGVGVEWAAGGTSVRVDAYRKWFDDLLLAPLAANPRTAPALAADGFLRGRGESSGLEVLARHHAGRRTLAVAYTLAWTERSMDSIRFAPRIDRRHSLDATGTLGVGARGIASARLVLASGQPFTPVVGRLSSPGYDPRDGSLEPGEGTVLYGPHNSARLPSYARLDVGMRTTLRRRWFGREGTLAPYVQVLNVLGAKNVMWAAPGISAGEPMLEYGPQLPVLPTVGVEWRF